MHMRARNIGGREPVGPSLIKEVSGGKEREREKMIKIIEPKRFTHVATKQKSKASAASSCDDENLFSSLFPSSRPRSFNYFETLSDPFWIYVCNTAAAAAVIGIGYEGKRCFTCDANLLLLR